MLNSDELAQKFDHEFSWAEKWVASHPRGAVIIILVLLTTTLIGVIL